LLPAILAALPFSGFAAEEPPAPLTLMQICRHSVFSSEEIIDATKRHIEQSICLSSLWFDGFFGDDYDPAAASKVRGNVRVSASHSEFYGDKVKVRLNARFPLPNLNRRLSAFVGSGNDQDFIRDRFDRINETMAHADFPRFDDEDRVFAGLGYGLPGNDRFKTDFRAGIRSPRHPMAFAQARLNWNAWADNDEIVTLRLTPFWTTRDHLGLTLNAEYSCVLSENFVARWSNAGTISDAADGIDWQTSLTLYQALHRIESGLAYEVFVRGETLDDAPLHEFGARTRFRHPIFGGRLYTEWTLGYSFPRENLTQRREGALLVGVGLHLPFGQTQD
jgi:hypothetical protein